MKNGFCPLAGIAPLFRNGLPIVESLDRSSRNSARLSLRNICYTSQPFKPFHSLSDHGQHGKTLHTKADNLEHRAEIAQRMEGRSRPKKAGSQAG